jgi:hypothetical protein
MSVAVPYPVSLTICPAWEKMLPEKLDERLIDADQINI